MILNIVKQLLNNKAFELDKISTTKEYLIQNNILIILYNQSVNAIWLFS